MTYTFWSSNTGGDGPTPVPPGGTGNSLRFRNDVPTYLSNTSLVGSTLSSYTVSFWAKRGFTSDGAAKYLLTSGSAGTNPDSISYNADGTAPAFLFRSAGGRAAPGDSGIRHRDPSAWYHVVSVYDQPNQTVTIYINGEQQAQSSATGTPSLFNESPVQIGLYADPTYTGTAWEGYLSDFYFIDGQALEPTAFGRYNEDGVWVPRDVDFTPTTMRYSDNVYANSSGTFTPDTTSKDFYPGLGDQPLDAFDGNTSTDCLGPNNGVGWTYYNFPDGLTDLTGFRVWLGYVAEARINEVVATVTTGSIGGTSGWVEFGSLPSSITQFAVKNESPNVGRVGAFEVTDADGTRILTNPFIWSSGCQAIVGTENPGANFTRLFNGALDQSTGYFQMNEPVSTMRWTPPTDINIRNTLGWYFYTPSSPNGNFNWEVSVDGVVSTGSGGQGGGETTIFTGSGKLDYVEISGDYCTSMGVAVDGQILVDGTNPSYGANGFHLDFSDPNDIGADRSGNGNNFTATGFDTVDPVNYASLVDWPATNSSPPNYPSNIFNGSEGQATEADQCYFDTSSPVTIDLLGLLDPIDDPITSVSAFVYASTTPGITLELNGSESTVTSSAWEAVTVNHDGSPVTSFTISAESPSTLAIISFRVNGTMLVNSINPNYDLMQDGPAQNYATLNPLYPSPSASLSDANLRVDDSNGSYARPNPASIKLDGNYYWEVTPTVAGASYPYVGVGILDPTLNSNEVFQQALYVAGDGGGGNFGVSISNNSFSTGTVLGFAYDSGTRELTVTYNGTNSQTFTASGTAELTPIVAAAVGAGAYVNYGQQPFLYTPPEGFSALQTQNLPEVTITNGRDHFQAITAGPNQGVDAGERGGNWSTYLTAPGVIWSGQTESAMYAFNNDFSNYATFSGVGPMVFEPNIEITINSSLKVATTQGTGNGTLEFNGNSVPVGANGVLTEVATSGILGPGNPLRVYGLSGAANAAIVAIEVDGEILVDAGPLAAAQATFPNGLWWIKSRTNSGNHQLLDSIRGEDLALTLPDKGKQAEYAVPGGECVAWTWNLAANRSNGFDIITWTGDTVDGRQIPHNLDASRPLDMVIVKGYDAPDTSTYIDAANWVTWHNAFPVNGFAYLNTNGQAGTTNSFWTATGPNSVLGNLTIGSDPDVNNGPDVRGGAIEYVAYLWQSIPGYSAFGSYKGNGSNDGTFIALSFRPAFVLVKNVDVASNWRICDSARSPNNPTELGLFPNSAGENEADGTPIDFLSNGFKHRTSAQVTNELNRTYIYAAFAENPFGSSNVSPANAR